MSDKTFNLAIFTLNSLQNIFSRLLEKRELILPIHFDLFRDVFLVAILKAYLPNIFIDNKVEKEIINHIYDKNIFKLKSTNFSEHFIIYNYPFVINHDFLIDSIISDFKLFSTDEEYTKKVMHHLMNVLHQEINEVNDSYTNFNFSEGRKIKLPLNFFITCFIHPVNHISQINKREIIYENDAEIRDFGSKIYLEINKEFLSYLKNLFKK